MHSPTDAEALALSQVELGVTDEDAVFCDENKEGTGLREDEDVESTAGVESNVETAVISSENDDDTTSKLVEGTSGEVWPEEGEGEIDCELVVEENAGGNSNKAGEKENKSWRQVVIYNSPAVPVAAFLRVHMI